MIYGCPFITYPVLAIVSNSYPSPCRQVAYVLLTRSPLETRRSLVRLACIRHAASVHPEPGSNSPFDSLFISLTFVSFILFNWRLLFNFYLVFKDLSYLAPSQGAVLYYQLYLPLSNTFFIFNKKNEIKIFNLLFSRKFNYLFHLYII